MDRKILEALIERAKKLKEKGLSERDIGDELHLNVETVHWLLTEGVKGEFPPSDIKIGWRSIGVFGKRIEYLSYILADIVEEEEKKRKEHFDTILGISINGIPLACFISSILDREFAIYRPSEERHGGAFGSNYAGVEGKKIVIVDDVLSTGITVKGAIKEIRENGGNPGLIVVIANKTGMNEIEGVPLRALVRTRSIGGTIIGLGIPEFPYKVE